MISLEKCSVSYSAFDDLSTKICFASETKEANAKVFNMITRINKVKRLEEHISCHFKWKFNSTTCNWNQKWKNE